MTARNGVLLSHATEPAKESDHLQAAHTVNETVVFGHVTDAVPNRHHVFSWIEPIDHYFPVLGQYQSEHRLDERALPRTVRTEQSDDAFGYIDGKVVQSDHAVILDRYVGRNDGALIQADTRRRSIRF